MTEYDREEMEALKNSKEDEDYAYKHLSSINAGRQPINLTKLIVEVVMAILIVFGIYFLAMNKSDLSSILTKQSSITLVTVDEITKDLSNKDMEMLKTFMDKDVKFVGRVKESTDTSVSLSPVSGDLATIEMTVTTKDAKTESRFKELQYGKKVTFVGQFKHIGNDGVTFVAQSISKVDV